VTKVKICGITNTADGLTAVKAGADLLGFVFYPPSQRAVTPSRVSPISAAVRHLRSSVMLVGVFVDEDLDAIAGIAELCDLDCVQLHGDETPGDVAALRQGGLAVIKGLRVEGASALARMTEYRPSYFLLDAYVPGEPGGTGRAFDWRIARSAARSTPLLLAGGLTPDNVSQAVRVARPWGVDVSTGVERAPGHKDPLKVRRFIESAKGALPEDCEP
jgi:phosphoribosylanthranilate isomerase